MKLHLGCGQNYLEGYVNIDFPAEQHSVQETGVADEYADILQLHYDPGSIEEIRLHHVFEHFSRPVAYALLVSWWSWLREGGRVHTEVPDFERTGRKALSRFSNVREKSVALRHIFGSNEAPWAVHYEGWSVGRMRAVLTTLGYENIQTRVIPWKGTFNIEAIAEKGPKKISQKEFESRVRNILSLYLIDDSESEQRLLEVWIENYRKQLDQTWARGRRE